VKKWSQGDADSSNMSSICYDYVILAYKKGWSLVDAVLRGHDPTWGDFSRYQKWQPPIKSSQLDPELGASGSCWCKLSSL
jgi:hypothetical protein